MLKELPEIIESAKKKIADTNDLSSLEQVRVQYLGKKGELTEILKSIGSLSSDERPKAGQLINEAKVQVNDLLEKRKVELEAVDLSQKLAEQSIDVTLPGRSQSQGHLHPVSRVRNRVENFFRQLGFDIADGPEIETEYYNFTALNIPEHHPARASHDTFYFDAERLLRTHTSPVQIRVLKEKQPPLKIIAVGRVYRCDSDLTHTPMFHQIEGLVLDEHSNFADLKGMLHAFMQDFFECDLRMRFRPSYFPFTEPSAEVDIECVQCQGKGCRLCSQTGWIEVLGCGMVHPNVLMAAGVNPQHYQGYAFGCGLDRLALLRYSIDDLRILFENDVRFLRQF
ncbi:MAG: phenylalanine--tRNA ligase subunit alpha [Gammaproteobacteria bacterium]